MTETTAVHGTSPAAPTPSLAPGTGRSILIGTIVGFFVVGGFCALAGYIAGMELSAALALGAFTGFWGGPGFGGMMGFVLHESKVEAAEEAAHDRPVERSGA
ncbi:MAG: hypothetical protein JST64_10680 [Actinobacteria bacterium]|nr:hypothetical protein [Actinomycetota bacterium]